MRVIPALLVVLLMGFALPTQRIHAQATPTAQQILEKMLALEDEAAEFKKHTTYLSSSRSDRTGGHLWTERIAEVSYGKLRYLIAEDGKPLSVERAAAERARMAQIAADPEGFRRQQLALKSDEVHAKQMLHLLPEAFLLDGVRTQGPWLRIDFKPNPDYSPKTFEERVLRAMQGYVLVEPKAFRLHYIEGQLPVDVNIGFGLLATVKAGSRFATERDNVLDGEWKTVKVDSDVNGKAVFFKTLAKREQTEHSDFRPLPFDMTVPQAVELLEK